jgi:hypothetical protein
MPHYKVELSEVLNQNPGFETGDFTSWNVNEDNASDIDVSTTTVFTGNYSVKIRGVESQANTFLTDVFSVNNKHRYAAKFYTRLDSNYVLSLRARIRHYNDASFNTSSHFALTNIYSDATLHNWQLKTFTFGPSGDNVNYTLTDSTNGVSLEFLYGDASSGNLGFIDNAMFLQLIDVTPEHQSEWSLSQVQIKNQNRAANSALFIRKQGEYDRIVIGQSNVAMQDATVINSWYGANRELLLEIQSGDSVNSFTTQPYSVMIKNNDTPFKERILPYDGEFQGMIELEGY